ncbi:hypothetical protein BSK49_03780 [Paenibacillus odorifer]|uniref:hypothetical protein n=1 Tax=Paenibacillus odorifer TaxID=189426 RepID=UPI00096C32EC|nr:hypothetical protein [Paenibacillus odorifer]OMD92409.1 hypothetical protein BSK49_03780 [Paenibacillus odorifer]
MREKKMRVVHTQIHIGGELNERVDIYAPGIAEPVHTLDRKFPAQIFTDIEAAVQSLTFGDIIAEKLAKKHRANGTYYESNVPGVVMAYKGAQWLCENPM